MNESQFNEDFMKSYNEESEVYFFEVDIKYPEELHVLHNNLPFLSKRKLVANLDDKKRICYSHEKFKTSIESWIIFEKKHRFIKFNQKA